MSCHLIDEIVTDDDGICACSLRPSEASTIRVSSFSARVWTQLILISMTS